MEDRGVRGHAAQSILGHQAGQLPGRNKVAADVVVPKTLAKLLQRDKRIHHIDHPSPLSKGRPTVWCGQSGELPKRVLARYTYACNSSCDGIVQLTVRWN